MKKSIKNLELLARRRTELAIERTYLSYLRTASASAIFGFGIFKLFKGPSSLIAAFIFVFFSLVIVLIGTYKFLQRKKGK